MPSSASAGGVHSLEDNDGKASLEEVLMVLGVVASGFFYARIDFASRLFIFAWIMIRRYKNKH
jgi:hypothetical protein